ncbi:MAG: hypothetical protein U1F81_07230 [Verrucomicrobiaceae bacterium]
MTYRLLIDYEALDVLASLRKPVQQEIHKRLRQEFPSQRADYAERDPPAVRFRQHRWRLYHHLLGEDFADRQVKVLEIAKADG